MGLREMKGLPKSGAVMNEIIAKEDLQAKLWALECERTKADWGSAGGGGTAGGAGTATNGDTSV